MPMPPSTGSPAPVMKRAASEARKTTASAMSATSPRRPCGVSPITAPIASGTFKTQGMVIAPCSIKTMSEIATGVTGSLLSRAADVVLKERRRLVLAVRETPLHGGHLRTMTQLADIGAIIAPIMPAFYNRPKTVDDIINHTVGRLLDLFGIDTAVVKRWQGGREEE